MATGADGGGGGDTGESFSVRARLKLIIHRYSLTLGHSDKFSHIPHPRCDEAVLETQVTCTRKKRALRYTNHQISRIIRSLFVAQHLANCIHNWKIFTLINIDDIGSIMQMRQHLDGRCACMYACVRLECVCVHVCTYHWGVV